MRLKIFVYVLAVLLIIGSLLANLLLLKTNESLKESNDTLNTQLKTCNFDRQRLDIRCKVLSDSLARSGKIVNTTNQTFYFGNTKIKK